MRCSSHSGRHCNEAYCRTPSCGERRTAPSAKARGAYKAAETTGGWVFDAHLNDVTFETSQLDTLRLKSAPLNKCVIDVKLAVFHPLTSPLKPEFVNM